MLNSDDQKKLGFFDPAAVARIGAAIEMEESVSAAGTINTAVFLTRLSISGTMALTLPDGTVTGQRKRIVVEAAASIPAATLTITTPETAAGFVVPSTILLDTVGQMVEFRWSGSKWRVVRSARAGTVTLTVNTTVTTSMYLYTLYALSVTGTVNSTGNKALPNGLYAGDRCTIGCSTAASIPVGSIDATVNLSSGAAGAGGTGGLGKLGNWGATTSNVVLEWNGTAWQVIASIGAIVAS